MSKNINVKINSEGKEIDHRDDICSDEECEFDELKSELHNSESSLSKSFWSNLF